MTQANGTPPGESGPPSAAWSRSAPEIEAALAALGVQLEQIAARPTLALADLRPGEHHALGVRAAALWTTGRTDVAPLTDRDGPADVEGAVEVMAIADDLLQADDTPESVAALAAGIRAWLLWLVGIEEELLLHPL